jgi:hypothetical protein
MNLLSASTLLSVWERGLVQRPHELAIALLTAALPEFAPDTLAHAPVGKRDGWLLDLREILFGTSLNCISSCARCGERLEITFRTSDIRQQAGTLHEDSYTHEVDGFLVTFRLPDSSDLEAIVSLADASRGRAVLITRCLLHATLDAVDVSVSSLPETVVSAVIDRIADLDPQADVKLALTCPSCDEQSAAVFDIVSFLGKEIDAWADKIVREVHELASAYGWREADILAMTPARRQVYLKLVN